MSRYPESTVEGDMVDVEENLFVATMERDWEQVVKFLKKYPNFHDTKLTKSDNTALHVAISTYHPKMPSSHKKRILEMIQLMKQEKSLSRVLETQNERGDTPLHLAAAVGWLRIFDDVEKADLIRLLKKQNHKGETLLFVAALHGNLELFRRLKRNKVLPDASLTRRKDGNTILHVAISRENLELAYMIIECYPDMVKSINEDGETPLHVLAMKPNVFKSSSHLGFYGTIIYHCVFVETNDGFPLENNLNRTVKRIRFDLENNLKYPENYTTCVQIFDRLLSLILYIPDALFAKCKNRSDEENQHHKENRPQGTGESSTAHGSSGAIIGNSTAAAKEENGFRSHHDSYPPNYVTCIELFKFAMKVILVILGVGFWRIQKIKEQKKQYLYAMKVLDKMIVRESRKQYESSGQRPPGYKLEIPELAHEFDGTDQDTKGTPAATSSIPDQDTKGKTAATSSIPDQDTKGMTAATSSIPDQVTKGMTAATSSIPDQVTKGMTAATSSIPDQGPSPILVAARTGIIEIVQKIHKKNPIAIQELDSKGKNVLMLAAEHRHTAMFDYLTKNLPKNTPDQFDEDGNSILHLAAKLEDPHPWRIPGAALQMQWEIKWYEHVKESLPTLSTSHSNKEGKTPSTIFGETHEQLKEKGSDWLIKTSESCSVVAALIAAVAFATASSVPGGLDQEKGNPLHQHEKAFDVFAVSSLVALCLSVTALVFFLAIITSRCEERDFERSLPRKLLVGLSCLFASITAILVSFCSGHTFILRKELKVAAIPIYASATLPVAFFAIAQLPLYFDLLRASCRKVPLRSYKVFCQ